MAPKKRVSPPKAKWAMKAAYTFTNEVNAYLAVPVNSRTVAHVKTFAERIVGLPREFQRTHASGWKTCKTKLAVILPALGMTDPDVDARAKRAELCIIVCDALSSNQPTEFKSPESISRAVTAWRALGAEGQKGVEDYAWKSSTGGDIAWIKDIPLQPAASTSGSPLVASGPSTGTVAASTAVAAVTPAAVVTASLTPSLTANLTPTTPSPSITAAASGQTPELSIFDMVAAHQPLIELKKIKHSSFWNRLQPSDNEQTNEPSIPVQPTRVGSQHKRAPAKVVNPQTIIELDSDGDVIMQGAVVQASSSAITANAQQQVKQVAAVAENKENVEAGRKRKTEQPVYSIFAQFPGSKRPKSKP